MFAYLLKLLLIARSRLKSRASLETENLVLRQQVIVLSRKSPSRVLLRNIDRSIFVWLYRCFPAILSAITVVKPETVIGWHRRGFRACVWRIAHLCRKSVIRHTPVCGKGPRSMTAALFRWTYSLLDVPVATRR